MGGDRDMNTDTSTFLPFTRDQDDRFVASIGGTRNAYEILVLTP